MQKHKLKFDQHLRTCPEQQKQSLENIFKYFTRFTPKNCAMDSFFFYGSRFCPATLLKNRLNCFLNRRKCFLVNLEKKLQNSFFIEQLWATGSGTVQDWSFNPIYLQSTVSTVVPTLQKNTPSFCPRLLPEITKFVKSYHPESPRFDRTPCFEPTS